MRCQVEGPNSLRKGGHSFCVCFQGVKYNTDRILPCLQQREESIVWVTEVLYYHPGLCPAALGVNRQQVRKPGEDSTFRRLQNPLEILLGAVPNLGCDASQQSQICSPMTDLQ